MSLYESAISHSGAGALEASPLATPSPAFGGWAELYWRFRPIYPTAVFDLLSALLKGRAELCVELGAGSGQATVCLLDRFAHVIAVEPDAAMAKLMPAPPRLTGVIATAEAYAGPDRPADAVVAASSLHWMDQAQIVPKAAGWLRPGGAFFAFGYGAIQYPGAGGAVHRCLQRHAQRSRAHVDRRLTDFAPYGDVLEASGAFSHVDSFELYADHRWSARELAGFLVSTSYGQATAQASGDAAGYFEDLAAAIARASAGKAVAVRFPIQGAFGLV
jgi:trans-aconitate methyltransferase